MKVINCYTLKACDESIVLHPGIPCEKFSNLSHPTICCGYNPVCSYAVEKNFKKLDVCDSNYWLVNTRQTVVNQIFFPTGITSVKYKTIYHYFRYFYNLSDQENSIYILIKHDQKIPSFSPDIVISSNENEVLLKLPRNSVFEFKTTKIYIGTSDVNIM